MRRRFDRPRNARWPILAILLALIAALFAPGIASAQPGRTYTIATDLTFAPFEFENEDGKLVGIDIDLLNAIAEDQGFKVDIKQLGFDAALQAVQAGQADGVIAGMSITDARKQVFDFSDPYFESGVQMAVLETDNDVKSYEDLRGKRVAVKNGTEGASFAESIKDQYGFTTVYFADSASMYDEVRTGNSVAVFDDYPVLAYGITQGNGLKTVTEKEVGASYGFAVNKGQNAELLQMFNAGLQNLRDDGQYDEIVSTYLGQGASTSDNSIIGLIKSTYAASQGPVVDDRSLRRLDRDRSGPRRDLRSLPRVHQHVRPRYRHNLRRHLPRHTAVGAGILHLLRHPGSPAFPDVRLHRRHHHALAQRRRVHG